MRFVSKSRLGFHPLSLSEAQRICRFPLFPGTPSTFYEAWGGGATRSETGAATASRSPRTSGYQFAERCRWGRALEAERRWSRVPSLAETATSGSWPAP